MLMRKLPEVGFLLYLGHGEMRRKLESQRGGSWRGKGRRGLLPNVRYRDMGREMQGGRWAGFLHPHGPVSPAPPCQTRAIQDPPPRVNIQRGEKPREPRGGRVAKED